MWAMNCYYDPAVNPDYVADDLSSAAQMIQPVLTFCVYASRERCRPKRNLPGKHRYRARDSGRDRWLAGSSTGGHGGFNHIVFHPSGEITVKPVTVDSGTTE
jgi:hypothetical protein